MDNQPGIPNGQSEMDTLRCRKPAEGSSEIHPWHCGFTKRVNGAESRAKTVSPLGRSLRGYFVSTCIVAFSLGLWALWPRRMPFLFPPQERSTELGTLGLGVAFLILGGMSMGLYLLDIVRGAMLARMDTRQLKRRLAKAAPAGRYVASTRHLRGMKIGAWFFGLRTLVVFAAGSIPIPCKLSGRPDVM